MSIRSSLAPALFLLLFVMAGSVARADDNPFFGVALQSAPYHSDEEIFTTAARHFDGYEWYMDRAEANRLSAADRQRYRDLTRRYDLLTSVHAPWTDDPRTPRGQQVVEDSIRFAQDVGATLVNIHYYFEYDLPTFVPSLLPLIRSAGSRGVRLAIENTYESGPEHFNELFARLRTALGADFRHVGMCLDVGHANLYGGKPDSAGTINDYCAYVRRLDPQRVPIIHAHFHENRGSGEGEGPWDAHRILFTGPAQHNDSGIRQVVGRLKPHGFSGLVVFEQYEAPSTSGQFPPRQYEARRRLTDIFQSVGYRRRMRSTQERP